MNKEIVLIMGYLAAGKSTLVNEYVSKGYHRINRDSTGGSLDNQSLLVNQAFNSGHNKIVLDNTYLTIESRESIIKLAKKLNSSIKCVWLNTSFEDAQFNACLRMVQKTGKILTPEELKNSKDPNLFSPIALYAARKKFEGEDKKLKYKGKQYPTLTEGFDSIEKVEFKRVWSQEYKNKALILDFDDTLRISTGPNKWPESPKHVKILNNRTNTLKQYYEKGYILLGASNQSAIAKGFPEKDCIECFEETIKQLQIKIEYLYCPHKVPPVSCYCRKPSPGMGVYWIEKYKLNPKECIMVGDSTSDKTFSVRCGFQYQHPDQFFK